ncbi:MAG: radical SAM/SPASM domain-containing protein [Nitrososphaeria archaeon]
MPLSALISGYIRARMGRKEPYFATYNVTYRCNSRCTYCDYWRRDWDELGTEDALTVVRRIAESGARVLDFSGGEPSLRRDIVLLMKESHDRGLFTSLSTNGLTVPRWLVEGASRYADAVTISLDGPEQVHDRTRGVPGGYRRAVEAIRAYRRAGVRTGISIVLSRENAGSVERLLQEVEDEVDYITFQPVNPPQGFRIPEEDLAALMKRRRKIVLPDEYFRNVSAYSEGRFGKVCDALDLYFSVDPLGNLNPCPLRSDVKLGSLVSRSFREIMEASYEEGRRAVESCSGCYLACTVGVSYQMKEPLRKSVVSALRYVVSGLI